MLVDIYIRPLIIALAVALAPHVISLPLWVTVWCALMWSYMAWGVAKGKPWPNAKIRHLLTFVSIAAVIMSNPRFGGDFYMGLLAVMAGLKPMEMRTHRDRMVAAFLAHFIVIAGLFKSETLFITMYMFVSVMVTTAVMIHLNHPQPMRQNLKLARRIMLQAAPLMAALFFLFPRIPSSLWGLNTQQRGVTGFSGNLELGDVSSLVRDDSVAFRAEFKQAIPNPDRLYWRGIVFDDFNGRGWNRSEQTMRRLKPVKGQDLVEYNLTLEPHGRRWVFALDMPIDVQSLGRRVRGMSYDLTLRTYGRIRRKQRFIMKSYLVYNTGPWRRWEQKFRVLPDFGNPQTRALADQWKAQGLAPQQIIDAALNYFRDHAFVYTLNPPPLQIEMIDAFLFETRKGYCEHYASAFVFLMRAAGLPARVVGGYLGGKKNPYSNFLVVRQADAHAWAEVWLQGVGWFRVDPTAVVVPQRITEGVEGSLASDEIPSFLMDAEMGLIASYWQALQYGWEAVNLQWDTWFSGYSFFEQKAILAKIGVDTLNRLSQMKILATATVIIVLAAFALFMRQLLQSGAPQNPVQRNYLRFCAKMERLGVSRLPAEGPQDYARRLIASREKLKSNSKRDLTIPINAITDRYVQLRYGGAPCDKETIRAFETMVKRL